MKKIYIGLFLMLLWCCAPVWAYNPDAPNQFSTMERNSWEFQSLYALTKAGLTGAPLSRFDSAYTLTRMEMAQMVVKAESNRGKGTAEQGKTIDRLATAFSAELENMGDLKPEVLAPADKEPIATVSGDSRIRYGNGVGEKIDGRVRIQFVAAIPLNQGEGTAAKKNTDKKAEQTAGKDDSAEGTVPSADAVKK